MKKLRQRLIVGVRILEILIAVLVMLAILIALGIIIWNTIHSFQQGTFQLEVFLSSVLTVVVGVEFVKMLFLQTPESVIEVLLYAVARQVILSHDSAMENLIGVSAVAVIFLVRTCLIGKNDWLMKKINGGKENEG